MDLSHPWSEYSYVAFDTETSGAWPLGSDIVEFGAVKWERGRIVDRLEMLFKPRKPMSDFIVGIHGITNEMVADAPMAIERAQEIRSFMSGSVAMAHHAPFDMGFLALLFEEAHISAPQEFVLCTSLLSRKLIVGPENFKLQTLIPFLGIPQGKAHRAGDDAEACLGVGLECMRRLGERASLEKVIAVQGKPLRWSEFSILSSLNPIVRNVVEAVKTGKDMEIVYDKGAPRRITPLGLVRNPDGDFVQAHCHRDKRDKRFYLSKINDSTVVLS